MSVIEKQGARGAGWMVLVLAMVLVAGCGVFPEPNTKPTCLPTSVPLDCVPGPAQER